MGDWVLTFARDLAMAVWLGGLIVIDFVETRRGCFSCDGGPNDLVY